MDKTQIIIFAVVIVFLAFRIYQKYIKKDKNSSVSNKETFAGTSFPSSSKDDEYEPYSKR